jgi:hypothetical protein
MMTLKRPKHPFLRYQKEEGKDGEIIVLREQWTPQTKRKIRRLSDGRVFSNSLGVALHYKCPIAGVAKRVEDNCNGETVSVYIGLDSAYDEFEWADSYADDVDRGSVNEYLHKVNLQLLVKLDEAKKLNLTNDATIALLSGRYTKFNTFKKLRLILTEMSPDFTEITEPIPFREFYALYAKIYRKYAPIETSIDMRSMARHMKRYADFYKELYGLIMQKLPCAEIGGQKIVYVVYDASTINQTYEDFLTADKRGTLIVMKFKDSLYPRRIVKINKHYRMRSIPIYAVAADYTYHSISIAATAHLTSKQEIISCCFGDIAEVRLDDGTVMKFKYGNFDDLDPTIDVIKALERYYQGNYGSRIGVPVFEAKLKISFTSIREASSKLKVPESYIRYSIRKNVEIEWIDAGDQTVGDEPIVSYYRFFAEDSEEFEEYFTNEMAEAADNDFLVT